MPKHSPLTSLFCRLVAIDSPSRGERAMGDTLKAQLHSLGFQVEEDAAGQAIGGNCGNIYAYLPGNNGAPPLLFCAHMDTVEPACGKRAVVGDDGVITSGGDTVLGADDLAGVAAILEAVREIRERGLAHRPVEVLFTVSEETYCTGARHFDCRRLRSQQAYVLDLSGNVGSAAYKAPSIISFQAEVAGRAAHAGFAPEQGVHAIQAAALAISRLPMGRLDDETVANIGLLQGGTASNIVPDRCVAQGEVRSYSHERAVRCVENIRAVFDRSAAEMHASSHFSFDIHLTAYETPLDHPVVERFRLACRQNGIEPSFLPTFGGSDNNVLFHGGITGLVLANAMDRCHSLQEYSTVDELEKIKNLALSLMAAVD